MTTQISRLVLAVALVCGSALAVPAAKADECGCYYKKVVTYVCDYVPYQVCVTNYDHCGRPYHTYVTKYRTVERPVVSWVKVCY